MGQLLQIGLLEACNFLLQALLLTPVKYTGVDMTQNVTLVRSE